MGEEGYQPTSNASPQPSSGPRLEKHKRSLSDTFDGSSATNRAGMPSAEPLGEAPGCHTSMSSLTSGQRKAAVEPDAIQM